MPHGRARNPPVPARGAACRTPGPISGHGVGGFYPRVPVRAGPPSIRATQLSGALADSSGRPSLTATGNSSLRPHPSVLFGTDSVLRTPFASRA